MAAPNRKPKVAGAVSSSTTLSSAAGQMLRSLGLEAVDPEHVFELQTKEGAGAFGRVYRACYKHDPTRLAALKVIPVALEAGQRGEDIESVRREIQFLRECDHPNVVAFYGAYYKDSALWVAMEYCGGGSVGDVRRKRTLREDEIAVIMRGALRGLAYLHSKKKIHRDIKGGNILLTTTGQVKIADFGVSAQLRDTMSRRGTFVGTPYWMSPEMIQDSDYDYKSDIWSLGITAIELADLKPPLFDEHPMRVLIQIPRNPPPQLQTPSAWTSAFVRFLRFCLQKDPLERPSALECLEHAFIRGVDHIDKVFSSDSLAVAAVTAAVTVTTTATTAMAAAVVVAPPRGSLAPEDLVQPLVLQEAIDVTSATNAVEMAAAAAQVESAVLPAIEAASESNEPSSADAEAPLLLLSPPTTTDVGSTQVARNAAAATALDAELKPPSDEHDGADEIAEDIAHMDDDDHCDSSSSSASDDQEERSDSKNERQASAIAFRPDSVLLASEDAPGDTKRGDNNTASSNSSDDEDEKGENALDRRSSSSASDLSVVDDDSREGFSFRQPSVGRDDATNASIDGNACVSMISGDELLQLSLAESIELRPPNATTHTPTILAPITPLAGSTTADTAHQLISELHLLPPPSSSSPLAQSPTKRNHVRSSACFTGSSRGLAFSISDHLNNTSTDAAVTQQPRASLSPVAQAASNQQRQAPASAATSSVTATAAAWTNPLAEISTVAQAAAPPLSSSLARMNLNLRHSRNLSLSSSLSSRMFTKLLQDEAMERTHREKSATLQQQRLNDSTSTTTQLLQTTQTLTPTTGLQTTTATVRPHHRHTRSSLSTSVRFPGATGTSSFLVGQSVSASFTSTMDARAFSAALASERALLDDSVSQAGAAAGTARLDATKPNAHAPSSRPVASDNDARNKQQHVSLDTALRSAVDNIWTDLEQRSMHSVEALLATANERDESFQRFRRTVLLLVAQLAKRQDEQQWSNAVLQAIDAGDAASGKTLAVPTTLQHVERWVTPALRLDAFQRLLESERRTRDKLTQLRQRFARSPASSSSDCIGSSSKTLEPARLEELLRWTSIATRTNNNSNSNANESVRERVESMAQHMLHDGAHALVHLSIDSFGDNDADANGNTTASEQRVNAILACCKREPSVANVVACMSASRTALTHLELDTNREQLCAVVQSTLQTHCRNLIK